MKLWSINFPIGEIKWAILCNNCNKEFIVHKPGLLLKFLYMFPEYCSFCGSNKIIIEKINE